MYKPKTAAAAALFFWVVLTLAGPVFASDLYPSFSPNSSQPQIHVNPGSVTASSWGTSGNLVYSPDKAVDGRRDTCWAEGVPGHGSGQWITFDFGREMSLTQIGFVPGYDKFVNDKLGDRFYLNPRVQTARVVFSDGSSYTLHFSDDRNMQYFAVPGVRTRSVQLIILDARPGSSQNSADTSISEASFWGSPAGGSASGSLYPSYSPSGGYSQIYLSPSNVYASSFGRDGNSSYPPSNSIDGRRDTCWAEGVPGHGIDQWIQFDFGREVTLAEIGLIPGYDKYRNDKYGDRFYLNPRVRRARIMLSNGETMVVNLDDDRRFQYFSLGERRTTYVRIVILDVRPGTSQNTADTSISEVQFYGR